MNLPRPSAALEAWRAGGRQVELCGHRLFVRDSNGTGKPLLLLIHGFPTSSFDWHRLWNPLARHFTLLAPDLLGFGDSDKPPRHAYSLLEQVDLLLALLRQRGAGTVHLLAHDYGDSVAQELLARHDAGALGGASPLSLGSVILLNGGIFPELHRARPIQRLLASPLGPLIARLVDRKRFGCSLAAVFGPDTQPSAAELDDWWLLLSRHDGHRIGHRLIRYIEERRRHRDRWVGALAFSRVPLRFINGLLDPVSGQHMVERYREIVHAADVVELPDVGHYPQIEATERVLDACLGFWRRLGIVLPAAP
jgi:pimeloyl-ACP methyl ester carboxylesterase